MDHNVYSFEQRSTLAFDASSGNRVIIANRRDPKVFWSTQNQPTASKSFCSKDDIKSWLHDCFYWVTCCNCRHCAKDQNENSLRSSGRGFKWARQVAAISNEQLDGITFDSGPFVSNEIKTSKYTLINFLPKNLFEQFRRLANFYFLTTAIIQMIMPLSPVGPTTSLLPLLFVVSTTAIKQAYEDYLRHKLDRDVNNRLCNVLIEKRLQRVKSKDIKVGDILMIRNNEEIPCDMVLLASSTSAATTGTKHSRTTSPGNVILNPGNVGGERCYITTANLDGETSLKSRTCFAINHQLGSIKEIDNTLLVLECERPNATLYEFNGFLRATRTPEAYEKLVNELNVEMNASLRSIGSGGNKSLHQTSHGLGNPTPNDAQKQQQQQQQQQQQAQTTPDLISTLSHPGSGSDPDKRSSIVHSIYKKIRRTRKDTQAIRLGQIAAQQLRHLGGQTDQGATGADQQQRQLADAPNNIEIPLDISNLLPRASRLRNTSFVYGLVVYTGSDTRLAHNSQVKPNKFSSLETRVNVYLIIAFLTLLVFTTISTLRFRLLKDSTKSQNSTTLSYLSEPNKTDHEYTLIELLMAHFVLYNYLVPISLYVTLEFVKFLGTIAVLEDKKLQVPVESSERTKTGNTKQQSKQQSKQRPSSSKARSAPHSPRFQASRRMIGAQCNSSDLNEDLGQVEVLFSDKTGTLTENKMRFMACSIGSNLFRLVSRQLYQQPEGLCMLPIVPAAKSLAHFNSNRYGALNMHLHAHPRTISKDGGRSKSVGTVGSLPGPQLGPQPSVSSMSSERLNLLPPEQRPFDHRTMPDLSQMKLVESLEHHPRVAEFFICLCLCSTITLNEQSELRNCLPDRAESYDLQTASPDEESLISAAAKFGIIICKASDRECFIAIQRARPSPKYLSPKSPGPKSAKQVAAGGTKSAGSQSGKKKIPSHKSSGAVGNFQPIVETADSNDRYIVRKFERLITFEFSSARKKMSVLYRDCDNDCLLLITKGSENVLDSIDLSKLTPKNEQCIDATLAHFEAFSKSGLRTMLVAKRLIGVAEYERIVEDQREARMMSTPADREQQLVAISRQVESRMQLIGATAVEDSLQDGVPETIADLKNAGIKVWLLTGDKVETAISVAYLCRLLDRGMTLIHLVRQQDSKSCREVLHLYRQQLGVAFNLEDDNDYDNDNDALRSVSSLKRTLSARLRQQLTLGSAKGAGSKLNGPEDEKPRFALIADGRSLHYAMKYSKQELAFVCKQCTCVLGCRLSPLQKAEIVDMIKGSDEKPICAAIGDGANDVSMIQEAHVGIGIRGKEGRQAVNSSDFALNRFHMLNRLFFVHGHLFYHRTANTIHYFFYKNMLFVLPQFLYSFYAKGSVTSLYHPFMLITYNLIFTSAPILLFGLFEVNIAKNLLEDNPRIYSINRRNRQMRYIVFLTWLSLGALQAIIAFYFLYHTYGRDHNWFSDLNKMSSKIGFATVLFFVIVYAATMRLFFLSKNPGYLFYLASVLSCALLPVSFYVISLFDLHQFFTDNSLYSGFLPLAESYKFWLAILSTLLVSLVPDVIVYIVERIRYNRILKTMIQSKPN